MGADTTVTITATAESAPTQNATTLGCVWGRATAAKTPSGAVIRQLRHLLLVRPPHRHLRQTMAPATRVVMSVMRTATAGGATPNQAVTRTATVWGTVTLVTMRNGAEWRHRRLLRRSPPHPQPRQARGRLSPIDCCATDGQLSSTAWALLAQNTLHVGSGWNAG